jgi:hypothetical protein
MADRRDGEYEEGLSIFLSYDYQAVILVCIK